MGRNREQPAGALLQAHGGRAKAIGRGETVVRFPAGRHRTGDGSMTYWKRLRMWRGRRQFEADLAEEIRIHREMSGGAAFGSEALTLEQSREVWGFAWLDSWKQDIRYAIRGLRRSPGFTIAAIAAIGLGIGLNTTMFTVFNAYALRPHAVQDPYSLFGFFPYGKNGGEGRYLTVPEFQALREQKA